LEQIQRHIDTLVRAGAETGVQVAVYRDGALIVDAGAGPADSATGRPLTAATPIFSFSVAKNVTATLAHLLVARGFFDYDSPVTDLWPEFGAHGKATATLRHILTHTVGLPAMPREITPVELPDWSRVCAALAAAEPRWPPGTATGYHSYTFGYLVGELARRATGRPMCELLREWITAPLGIEGQLAFATPEEAIPGLAHLEQPARPRPAGPHDGAAILAPWESQPSAEFGNSAEILRAAVPSVGIVTARGLAAMFDAVLRGELMDAARLARLSALAFEGTDQVFGTPARMALGFPLGRIGAPAEEHSVAFGWPGGGGSYAYADPARRIAFALTKTRLVPNFDTALSVTTILARSLAGTAEPSRGGGNDVHRPADQPRSVLLTRRQPDAVGGDGVGAAPDPEVPPVHGSPGRPPPRDTVAGHLGARRDVVHHRRQRAEGQESQRQPAVRAEHRNRQPDRHGLRHRGRREPGHRRGHQASGGDRVRTGLRLAAHARGWDLARAGRRRPDRQRPALPGAAGQGIRVRQR
jgi:CubicO group peptidase (beta-lactamase class C family)